MTPTQLVGQVSRFGFSLYRTPSGFSLKPTRDGASLPDWLRGKLAASKPDIVSWLDRIDLPATPREDVIVSQP